MFFQPKKQLYWLIVGFMCLCHTVKAQKKAEDILISIQVNQIAIEKVLKILSEQSGLIFSYTPALIDVQKRISLSLRQRTIKEALDIIFEQKVKYKFKGKYIILSKNDAMPARIVLRGYIREADTKKPIPFASIYVPAQWSANLSNQYGYFEVSIDAQLPMPTKVRFSKQKYWSEEYLLSMHQDQVIAIGLRPQINDSLPSQQGRLVPDSLRHEAVKISTVDISQNRTQGDEIRAALRKNYAKLASPIANFFLSLKQKAHLRNVNEVFFRSFQFSVLPSISTNKLLGSNTVNKVSLNLLGGYNEGVEIFELGGLFNSNKNNVRYFQMGGIFNTVGGSVDGLQAAGIFNIVYRRMLGLQAGGIYNQVKEDMLGLQAAGLLNIVQKNTYGLQAAGLVNITQSNMQGMQAAGLLNIAQKNTHGFQGAGLVNITQSNMEGMQAAGLLNIAQKKAHGLQIAGLMNLRPKDLHGMQIAGLANFSRKQTRSVQIAGLLNHTHFAQGGLQLGLINLADSAKGLMPIGLLSFVKKGQAYQRLEINVDELLNLQLSFKTGVPAFYNILSVGTQNINSTSPALLLGYGLGTSIFAKSAWSIDFNLHAANIRQTQDPWLRNALLRANLLIEKKIGKHFSIAAGGGICAWWSDMVQPFEKYFEKMPQVLLHNGNDGDAFSLVWIGYQGGIRWVLR